MIAPVVCAVCPRCGEDVLHYCGVEPYIPVHSALLSRLLAAARPFLAVREGSSAVIGVVTVADIEQLRAASDAAAGDARDIEHRINLALGQYAEGEISLGRLAEVMGLSRDAIQPLDRWLHEPLTGDQGKAR